MTPIEYAGLAIANEFSRIFPGSRPSKEDRERLARAAFLAATECDLRVAATSISGTVAMRVHQNDRIEVFKAIGRAIAKQGNPMPDAPPPPTKNTDGQ